MATIGVVYSISQVNSFYFEINLDGDDTKTLTVKTQKLLEERNKNQVDYLILVSNKTMPPLG